MVFIYVAGDKLWLKHRKNFFKYNRGNYAREPLPAPRCGGALSQKPYLVQDGEGRAYSTSWRFTSWFSILLATHLVLPQSRRSVIVCNDVWADRTMRILVTQNIFVSFCQLNWNLWKQWNCTVTCCFYRCLKFILLISLVGEFEVVFVCSLTALKTA